MPYRRRYIIPYVRRRAARTIQRTYRRWHSSRRRFTGFKRKRYGQKHSGIVQRLKRGNQCFVDYTPAPYYLTLSESQLYYAQCLYSVLLPPLAGIGQGTTLNYQMYVKGFKWEYQFSNLSTTSNRVMQVRVMVLQKLKDQGDLPGVKMFSSDSQPYQPQNFSTMITTRPDFRKLYAPINKERYKVLYNKVHKLNLGSNSVTATNASDGPSFACRNVWIPIDAIVKTDNIPLAGAPLVDINPQILRVFYVSRRSTLDPSDTTINFSEHFRTYFHNVV